MSSIRFYRFHKSVLPPAAAYPRTGDAYLADPGIVGSVTRSSLPGFTDSTGALRDHDIFRIEGAPGSNLGGPGIDFIETTHFSLMGRAFSDTVPGRVTLDRASYTASACAERLGVFACGFETMAGALGSWTLDIRGVTGLADATTLPACPNALAATSSFAGASTVGITYK
jgi:hypothetical protein